jgi:predicted anti-sigma-YlaC factor YlaD
MTMAHDHNRGDCLAMFAKLSEYLDNELDDLTCKNIEDHARACIPCKACLETLRQTIGLCRSLAPEEQPVPEAFSKQLKALIHKLSSEKTTAS